MRIVWMSLLALRSKISLAVAMSPVAIWETIATTMIGIRQISTLRKIRASSRMMSRMVASPTISRALLPDSCWSYPCATVPVTPYCRSPPTDFSRSARSCLTASNDASS